MADKEAKLFVVDLKLDDVKVDSGMVLVRAVSGAKALHHLATARKATAEDVARIGSENIVEADKE